MKIYKTFPAYPELYRFYSSMTALADVINRSKSYVNNCLNGRSEFTDREKRLIVADMGKGPEAIPEIFA